MRIGLILLRVDASVNMIMNLQNKKKTEVSHLAKGVCSVELNNTLLRSLVTTVYMAAFNFQEPNSYVHIKIYKL